MMAKKVYYVNYYHQNSGMFLGANHGSSVADLERLIKSRKKVGGVPIKEVRCEIVESTYVPNKSVHKAGYVERVVKVVTTRGDANGQEKIKN